MEVERAGGQWRRKVPNDGLFELLLTHLLVGAEPVGISVLGDDDGVEAPSGGGHDGLARELFDELGRVPLHQVAVAQLALLQGSQESRFIGERWIGVGWRA